MTESIDGKVGDYSSIEVVDKGICVEITLPRDDLIVRIDKSIVNDTSKTQAAIALCAKELGPYYRGLLDAAFGRVYETERTKTAGEQTDRQTK